MAKSQGVQTFRVNTVYDMKPIPIGGLTWEKLVGSYYSADQIKQV